jgi:allophanate hydrolase
MSGLPLNHQLLQLGGRLVRACKTAPVYRMYALLPAPLTAAGASGVLPHQPPCPLPPRPALIRVADAAKEGCAFEVEVWSLPVHNVG